MANPWFRVWTDLVNDPKWRTVARKSGQSIGDVIAVYMHMLTCASNAEERGKLEGWCDEDVATALDIDAEKVEAIREAMQGRVVDGVYLTGWEKRQPKREREDESAADRKKKQRLVGAQVSHHVTPEKTMSHHVTPCHTKNNLEEIREEEIRKENSKADASALPKKPRTPTKSFLPNDFRISDRVRAWALEKGYTNLDRHLENFVSACRAKGYQYVDWDESFMGAIRNDWAKLNGAPKLAAVAGYVDPRWKGAK